MRIAISRTLLEEILTAARASPKAEICGLLLGDARRIGAISPAENVAADPARHFEIDPHLLFAQMRAERAGGLRAIGHYHSHPNGRAEPSATDAAAVGDPRHYWLIVAGDAVSLWRADAADGLHGRFARVELVIE